MDKIQIISDVEGTIKDLQKKADGQKARMKKITKQMVRDVPRMAGKRVSERYNIPASEIYPPQFKVKTNKETGAKYKVKKAAGVKITGETLDTINIEWTGRRLTIQRFKMKPKTPTRKEGAAVSFEILRGKRKALESNGERRYFVQNIKGVTQGVSATNNKGKVLNRKIDRIEKTLSIPIMIDNETVNKNIHKDINEKLKVLLNKTK